MMRNTILVIWQSHLIPLPFLQHWEGSSFQGLVPSDDTIESNSVMEVKIHESWVVIMYHLDKFTSSWLAECFLAHPQIYPGIPCKMSSVANVLLEHGCEDYSLLDELLRNLSMVSIPSLWILSTHWNWMCSLMNWCHCFFSVFRVHVLD